jgi:hypothetical protein
MRRRQVLLAAVVGAFACSGGAFAAEQRRIGLLSSGSSDTSLSDAFYDGLRESGFIVGQNITIEYRWADGQYDRLAAFAAELSSVPVDVIVASALPSALAAKQATSTIPIVFVMGADPVLFGLTTNLARPSSNVTGVFQYYGPLDVLWHPDAYAKETMDDMVTAVEEAAATLKLRLEFVAATRPVEFAKAFASIAKDRPEALLEFPSQCSMRAGRSWFGLRTCIGFRPSGTQENSSSLADLSCTEPACPTSVAKPLSTLIS